jgi:hypothetical protein
MRGDRDLHAAAGCGWWPGPWPSALPSRGSLGASHTRPGSRVMSRAGAPSVSAPREQATSLGLARPVRSRALNTSASCPTQPRLCSRSPSTQRLRIRRRGSFGVLTVTRWTEEVIPHVRRRQDLTWALGPTDRATQASVWSGGRRRTSSTMAQAWRTGRGHGRGRRSCPDPPCVLDRHASSEDGQGKAAHCPQDAGESCPAEHPSPIRGRTRSEQRPSSPAR